MTPSHPTPPRRRIPDPWFIFFLALLVRLAYLLSSARNPTFYAPVLDSFKYDLLARGLVEQGRIGEDLFQQSAFYPLFLAALYWLSGCSIAFAKLVQMILGALTCVLVYRLGRRLFDRRAGLLAGAIAAFYGPMFFYDGELLATGWEMFWSVALLLLLLDAADRRRPAAGFALGLAGGLAVLARPNFLVVFAAGLAWLAWRCRSARDRPRQVLAFGATLAAGFLVAAVPFAAVNRAVTGDFTILPQYGGLNFYYGNQPDSDYLQTIRPGPEWIALKNRPLRVGIADPAAQQAWFYRQALDNARANPGAFLRGLGWKTLQWISSREIPNSVEIYVFHPWSALLTALTWKVSGFGFPFGVLLPLALLGWIVSWRRLPAIVTLDLALYSLTIIAVHVCARYRVPIVPLLIPLGAAGAIEAAGIVRRGNWMKAGFVAAGAGVVIALASLPGPFSRETIDFEAEVPFYASLRAVEDGRLDAAVASYREALRLKPGDPLFTVHLGIAFMAQGRLDAAQEQFEAALATQPEFALAHLEYGLLFAQRGEIERATTHFAESARIDPTSPEAWFNLGMMRGQAGRFEEAARDLERAIALRPTLAEAYDYLGRALLMQGGRPDRAAAAFARALRLNPDLAGAHQDLGLLALRAGRLDQARGHLRRAAALARAQGDRALEAEILEHLKTVHDAQSYAPDALRTGPDDALDFSIAPRN